MYTGEVKEKVDPGRNSLSQDSPFSTPCHRFRLTSSHLRLATSQADTTAQNHDGLCLKNGEAGSKDLTQSVRSFTPAAHPINLKAPAHFKLAADESFAAARRNYRNADQPCCR
jgi:hypothetical protein